jgi:hypothetical protein
MYGLAARLNASESNSASEFRCSRARRAGPSSVAEGFEGAGSFHRFALQQAGSRDRAAMAGGQARGAAGPGRRPRRAALEDRGGGGSRPFTVSGFSAAPPVRGPSLRKSPSTSRKNPCRQGSPIRCFDRQPGDVCGGSRRRVRGDPWPAHGLPRDDRPPSWSVGPSEKYQRPSQPIDHPSWSSGRPMPSGSSS